MFSTLALISRVVTLSLCCYHKDISFQVINQIKMQLFCRKTVYLTLFNTFDVINTVFYALLCRKE